MRYIGYTGLALLLLLSTGSASLADETMASPKRVPPDSIPADSGETTRLWNMARKYKDQMRYEMARQHYLLALATCRSDETVQRIQRELQIVELQIRSLR
ncbi:MAG: hypothetical protein RRY29_10315 [Desulfovibrionaceae bacterium]